MNKLILSGTLVAVAGTLFLSFTLLIMYNQRYMARATIRTDDSDSRNATNIIFPEAMLDEVAKRLDASPLLDNSAPRKRSHNPVVLKTQLDYYLVSGNRLIRIFAFADNPQEAADIANILSEVYESVSAKKLISIRSLLMICLFGFLNMPCRLQEQHFFPSASRSAQNWRSE